MSYEYAAQRPRLFTEDGAKQLIETRDRAIRLLGIAGAFTACKAMGAGESWMMLAALDYMVERGEIIESSPPGCWGQDRVFTSGRKP